MPRRRWIQNPNPPHELIEVTDDFVLPPARNGDRALWGDRHYDGLTASDGTDISTRTKHREYMRERGLTTADDFKGEWEVAARARADFYLHGADKHRKDDVSRAIHNLTEGKRHARRRR